MLPKVRLSNTYLIFVFLINTLRQMHLMNRFTLKASLPNFRSLGNSKNIKILLGETSMLPLGPS